MSATPIKPVKVCIYCGATEFKPGGHAPLADEHIIPFGLNGTLVLPEASCKHCGDITGRMESIWLRGSLLGCRTLLGLRTRTPKDRPKALPLFDTTKVPDRKIMVSIADYPVSLLLPTFAEPALLTGANPLAWGNGVWHKFFTKVDGPLLARKYSLTKFATSAVDSLSVARSLAKIAHSFSVAALGVDGFEPVLRDYILGRENGVGGLYVGGAATVPPPIKSLHHLELSHEERLGTAFLVVSIRLFAEFGTPTYRVVSGKQINSKPLSRGLLAAA